MHPDIATALAYTRIDDLHRGASQHRLARQAVPPRSLRATIADRLHRSRVALTGWLNGIQPTRATAPDCCPA